VAAGALGDLDSAAALRQASAHWLRHSMLTNHANNGVQLKTLQDTAGHASIVTTAAYLHKSDLERHDEIMASVNGNSIA
jgi:integrase/recombinase XerD